MRDKWVNNTRVRQDWKGRRTHCSSIGFSKWLILRLTLGLIGKVLAVQPFPLLFALAPGSTEPILSKTLSGSCALPLHQGGAERTIILTFSRRLFLSELRGYPRSRVPIFNAIENKQAPSLFSLWLFCAWLGCPLSLILLFLRPDRREKLRPEGQWKPRSNTPSCVI